MLYFCKKESVKSPLIIDMAKFELKLPQMGESVAEATITTWLKEVGDFIELDEGVLEIATDKVDTEVPSEVAGVLLEKRFNVDDVVAVGDVIAVIEAEGETVSASGQETTIDNTKSAANKLEGLATQDVPFVPVDVDLVSSEDSAAYGTPEPDQRFYSPLVKNIAKQEGLSLEDLSKITGTGSEGRVTKNDILAHLALANKRAKAPKKTQENPVASSPSKAYKNASQTGVGAQAAAPTTTAQQAGTVVALSRMGKLVAEHMVKSVQTAAHVQSFIEVDVTKIVAWRNKIKGAFEAREDEKFTFTPIFMEAVAMALKAYPMMNVSLDGNQILKHKNINIGMAAALPDGNLIVPVIKNADQLNLTGMAKAVNDLAQRARDNALKPDEIKQGTYTVTNVGSFGSVFGTPIINQPQVGILALGAIRKVPAVIETAEGDFIGIRSKMFLSHSYDHRVVNGALGGMFIKTIAEYLEAWDVHRTI